MRPATDIEVGADAIATEARRRALLIVVRAHPKWTLEEVLTGSVVHQELLAGLTIRELRGYDPRRSAGLPRLPLTLYERAERLAGHDFDVLLFEVLLECEGPVQTGYLRARLGGPRWKVKLSLERLCAAGFVEREGGTSGTRYRTSQIEVEDGCVGATGLIDVGRWRRASALEGDEYAAIVAEILAEADKPVRARYVRERAGGPHWKVNKALNQLRKRGLVERVGKTSDTTWVYVGR